jgi:hypothetical protein
VCCGTSQFPPQYQTPACILWCKVCCGTLQFPPIIKLQSVYCDVRCVVAHHNFHDRHPSSWGICTVTETVWF